jgi:hypothetical protein
MFILSGIGPQPLKVNKMKLNASWRGQQRGYVK